MINTVIKQIEGQQAGKENTAPYYVGEQLKDIIRNNPQAAEIVGQDLKIKEMSIVECEKKIKAYADKHKKNNFACVTPQQAENMYDEIDYILARLNEPPKGLADWCNEKRKMNLLIYRVGYYYEPLEDRNKKCVKCKCTACGAVTKQYYSG